MECQKNNAVSDEAEAKQFVVLTIHPCAIFLVQESPYPWLSATGPHKTTFAP